MKIKPQMEQAKTSPHFGQKDAARHIAEVQARGILTSHENHVEELPGFLSSSLDAARNSAIFLSILMLLFQKGNFTPFLPIFLIVSFGLIIWKMGRSAWLGWAHLERLHHLLEQEKWEIEHNREQEREELTALYHLKGFEGKLLEDVVEVLVSDSDRLLKVMVEEELGLSLAKQDHPLLQAVGAGLGVFITSFLMTLSYLLFFIWNLPYLGGILMGFLILGVSAFISSRYEGNRVIPAFFWLLGIGILSIGAIFFLLDMVI